MRRLNKAVVAGGVVYRTGMAATPELEELIPDEHWDGAPEPAAPAPADAGPVPYLDWKKADLEAEVEKRNFDRDPDDEAYIQVEAPGDKPELAAALQADDDRPAD